MDFSGTITLTLQTFVEVLTQVASSVHAHGFNKMLFLNGHGGNGPMITAMRRELAAREGISTVGYAYWQLPGVNEEMRAMSESDKGVIGHAGEMETSLELYLQPELVDTTTAQWGPGVKGDPTKGTREKGERLVNAAVNGLIKILRDCHSGALEERLTLFRKDIVIDDRFRPVG
jgi:creatinine amidohydrolase/Fe(II)-dependent formamide hydrolase-like protein